MVEFPEKIIPSYSLVGRLQRFSGIMRSIELTKEILLLNLQRFVRAVRLPLSSTGRTSCANGIFSLCVRTHSLWMRILESWTTPKKYR